MASSDGNFSPVNRRTASFVSSVRHLRGEIGDELNNLAIRLSDIFQCLANMTGLSELVVDVQSYLLETQWCDQA